VATQKIALSSMIVYAYLKFLKYDKAQRPLQFSDLCILNLEILGPVLTHSMVVVSEKKMPRDPRHGYRFKSHKMLELPLESQCGLRPIDYH